jgi:ASPM-SPD-2-Hydin domain-containing protein
MKRRTALTVSMLSLISAFIGLLPGVASAAGPLSPSPHHLNYGRQAVGGSYAIFLTITNNGTATEAIEAVSTGDPFNLESSSIEDCTSVAPGSSCTLIFTFDPASPGQYRSTLTMAFDNGGGDQLDLLTVRASGHAYTP